MRATARFGSRIVGGRRGVLAEFHHEHRFLPHPDGGCTMLDMISYRLPAGWLGALVDQLVIRRHLLRLLRDRNTEVRRTAAHRVS
ncbi:MAG: hypothetical protein ACT4NY_27980 [Pseudonocardiales bacterium]